jgi:hypothetical protein
MFIYPLESDSALDEGEVEETEDMLCCLSERS